MTKKQAWWQFTKERFEPVSHLTMILVFIIAHILVARASVPLVATSTSFLTLLIGVIAFYFKLRLYDEVKDYELDVVINKTRPLPRGLLNHKDMYRGMGICILIEIVSFSIMGKESSISITIAIAYSLLMYKEFFIADKIRPYLTTYALIHTIVTTLLSFSIFSYLTKLTILEVIATPSFLSFAMANWLLFNIFEFGRKTFASSEERQSVDTYSSLFGRTGAVILVASQAVITYYLASTLNGVNNTIIFWGLGSLLVLLAALSLNYIFADSSKTAKRFRLFSSVYIIIYYLILISSYLRA
jgi:hypothetical protein